VIPTFHPAAILRSGGEGSRQFGDFRDDFELIRDTLASDATTSAPPPTVAPAPEPAVEPDPPVEAPAIVTVPPSLPQDEPVPEGQLELF
jgi:hypothetical protein